MSEYLSARELSELKIICLPTAIKNIIERANRELWLSRKRSGRGGGVEYEVASMPADIQAAIREKQAEQILASAKPAPLPSVVKKQLSASKRAQQLGLPLEQYNNGLTEKQRDVAHARMVLCAEVGKMNNLAGLGLKEAVQYVISQIETGVFPEHLTHLVEVANARGNGKRTLCFSTLYSWVRAFRGAATPTERMAALAPRKTKSETPLLAYDWLPEFMSFWQIPSAPKVLPVYRKFARAWQQSGRDIQALPSIDQVHRVLKKLPVIARERGRKTGSEYKSLLPYVKRDWLALSPNDVWIGDGHSFKAKVAHPIHGRPYKPEVTVIIDCCRMVMGFSISLAESTVAVADALRTGIKHFGRPLMYYSDNGGGQTGKKIDHEVTGYCARLGIHHQTGIPGNPQGRGIIEGWWDGTLINLAREYETFTGNGMDSGTKNLIYRKMESAFRAEQNGKELTTEQRHYKAKLPSFKQFYADVAACIDDYNHRPHRSLPKNADGQHYTPAEYRALRITQGGVMVDRLTDIELDTLFMPEEIRRTTRGLVSIMDNSYFHVDLAVHHGENVRVAYDLDDYKTVIVRDMAGKFICKAAFEGNKTAAQPETAMEQLHRKRAEGRVKNKMAQIEEAMAELQPAIEHQPDFGLLVGNGQPEMGPIPVQKKPQFFMFESEREEWELTHGAK